MNAKSWSGDTPLHYAAWNNAREVAEYLVTVGADVKAKNNGGDTPLHIAAGNNAREVAEYLVVAGTDVNAKNGYGTTPLHIAAGNNAREVAEYLVENGGSQNDLKNIKVGDIIDVPPSIFEIMNAIVPDPRKGRVMQILQDHFIDSSVKHTVLVLYGEENDHEKFMQFEGGPVRYTYNVIWEKITTCRHPETGLIYLLDIVSSGGSGGGEGFMNFIGVNAETHELEGVYSEYAFRDDGETLHDQYNDEICVWPAKQEKSSIFSGAMTALRIEDDKIWPNGTDEDSVYASLGQMEVGDSMQLPWRSIPANIVQAWLEKLSGLLPGVVFIDGKISPALANIDHDHIDGWDIIQITGTQFCSEEYGQGVVLVKHASQQDWRAIYNVKAGCTRATNYPLSWEEEKFADDQLLVTMYYDYDLPGRYRAHFVIDLNTNVITKVFRDSTGISLSAAFGSGAISWLTAARSQVPGKAMQIQNKRETPCPE